MNRREAIQRAGMALGYTLSGPVLLGVLNGCKAEPELAFAPQFLTKEQAHIITRMVDIIIPETDTPGAVKAGVPAFIDTMLKDVYTAADQTRMVDGIEAFDKDAANDFGKRFSECDAEEQKTYLKKVHDEVIGKTQGNDSFGWWRASGGGEKPFIMEVKELTIIGFFTSEPGATEVLQYNQVPGPFKGCVPLAEVGKTWAT